MVSDIIIQNLKSTDVKDEKKMERGQNRPASHISTQS